MTPLRVRRTLSALAAVLLPLALLSSCSSDSSSSSDQVATRSASAEPAETVAPVAEETPEAPTECVPADPTAIPDGTFEGPIELKVTGEGFSGKGFSGGTGTMTIEVASGRVTAGTWNVAWNSKGGSDTNGIKLTADVDGTIAGTVAGRAAKPELTGSWTLDGEAVTDVAGTIPLHFTGVDTEAMAIEATGCDAVTGTFIPSFNAEAAGGTSFTGTAAWTGSRTG